MTRQDGDWLRPADAAIRYGISERTLARWADAGLIGVSMVGRAKFYAATDIDDLIRSHARPRTVVPMVAVAEADDSWKSHPLWRGVAR